MLPTPDGPPPSWNAGSAWRAVVPTPLGDQPPEALLQGAKPSPLASKTDKALLLGLTDSTLDRLISLVDEGGDQAPPAAVALGLRAADVSPNQAVPALELVMAADGEPWNHKSLRKHLPDLLACVVLAPGVRAVVPLDRTAMGLLLAEMQTATGRQLDSVSVLESLPMSGAVGLAVAASYLATGRSTAVVSLTDNLQNVDDLSALGFVARSVALRTLGRHQEAVEALDQALASPLRDPGVLAAALEERAAILGQAGEALAAQADIELLQEVSGGAGPRVPAAVPALPGADGLDDPEDRMAAARTRVRRQLRGTGRPGTFGGRHHSTYQDEVEAILGTDHPQTVESLLLGLMDAVEDEADELGRGPIDSTYYLTLADLFVAAGDNAAHAAVMERYRTAAGRFGEHGEPIDPPPVAAVTGGLDHPVEAAPEDRPPPAVAEAPETAGSGESDEDAQTKATKETEESPVVSHAS